MSGCEEKSLQRLKETEDKQIHVDGINLHCMIVTSAG